MSKGLCLVLSFIIGASVYQNLEAGPINGNMLIQNRENAQNDFNAKQEKVSVIKIGKHTGNNQSDTGSSNNDSNADIDAAKMNMQLYNNVRDENLKSINLETQSKLSQNNQALNDITSNIKVPENDPQRGHLVAEYQLSMTTVNSWDDMRSAVQNGQGEYSKEDAANLTKQVLASNDVTLITHAVNSMGDNTVDEIKKKDVKLTDTVTHLFPDKEKATYDEIIKKYDELRTSYTIASATGNTTYANTLKGQMNELGALAGELVGKVKGATLNIEEMDNNITAEENHAKKVNEDETRIDWSGLSVKDQLLQQSKHLQETFNAGLNTDDDERYQASKEVLDRAVELNDYESLKLIRESTQKSAGGLGGMGATDHPNKILKHEVTDENGNKVKVQDLEAKIDALREEQKNNKDFDLAKEQELNRYVSLYGQALNEYAEKNSSGGRWWVQIPEKEFEAAEHQNNHIETFRRENTIAAHYNNKTSAAVSGETNSK